MATLTKIEWTDHTWNPWRGCTKVSDGCKFCYADAQSVRNPKVLGRWGPQGARVVAAESYWHEPFRWAKAAEKRGEPAKVFCASLADVFEQWEGPMHSTSGERLFHDGGEPPWRELGAGRPVTMDHGRARVFGVIEVTAPWLIWQLVTKRPENARRMAPSSWRQKWPENVWLITSVESQEHARRVAEIANIPAKVRGISAEPLLGPLDLTRKELYYCNACAAVTLGKDGDCAECSDCRTRERSYLDYLDWVIVGGESGPHARPCGLEWMRDLVRQCAAAKVACFVKQIGSQPRNRDASFILDRSDPKGGDPEEWPMDLRVRAFPAWRAAEPPTAETAVPEQGRRRGKRWQTSTPASATQGG